MKTLMKLDGICKVFEKGKDELIVLDDINLKIEENEFIAIIGPWGCGKSTLIKIMGGVILPTLGMMEFNGSVCHNGIPKTQLKNISTIFQQNAMLEWRTVRQNLRLNLEILKLKGSEWEMRIDTMLEMAGLQDYQNMFPFELSGGMLQRASIARSLVHNPKLLLMDQPFGALDAITRKMLAFDVLNIWKRTQKTIVMVTNDIEEALLLSTRILVMSCNGSIRCDFQNDIPFEARKEDIILNTRFNELHQELNGIIHKEENLSLRKKNNVKG